MVRYKNGDLFGSKCNVICHQVNCQGVMGAGIAKTIRDRYPMVYQRFLARHQKQGSRLGDIDIIYQQDSARGLYIVNLYAQDNYLPRDVCHTDYSAFKECLEKLKTEICHYRDFCLPKMKFKIGFPDHIGCGLAGGLWSVVKGMIETAFSGQEWDVEVWNLK